MSSILANLMFGNIDEDGELEDDSLLDKESKRQLSQITCEFGLDTIVDDFNDDEVQDEDYRTSGNVPTSRSAVDFIDIQELAEDNNDHGNCESTLSALIAGKSSPNNDYDENDDYDMDDCTPSLGGNNENKNLLNTMGSNSLFSNDGSFATSPTDSEYTKDGIKVADDHQALESEDSESQDDVDWNQIIETYDQSELSNNKELLLKNLAKCKAGFPAVMFGMSNDKDGIVRTRTGSTVIDLFPEFKPGEVLRFTRLFGPARAASMPQVWRNARRTRKRRRQEVINEGFGHRSHCSRSLPHAPSNRVAEDDEVLFLSSLKRKFNASSIIHNTEVDNVDERNKKSKKRPKWRFGPARYWYDQKGLPEDGSIPEYKSNRKEAYNPEKRSHGRKLDISAYTMLAQQEWENNIIWSADDVRQKRNSADAERVEAEAGWIPSTRCRTFLNHLGDKRMKTSESMFPIQNRELVYTRWEDNIIWDTPTYPSISTNPELRLDPNDENILCIPYVPDKGPVSKATQDKETKKEKGKGKTALSKSGASKIDNMELPEEMKVKDIDKDSYNFSNDAYYSTKTNTTGGGVSNTLGVRAVLHSTPSVQLNPKLFPTHWTPYSLRNFHRPIFCRPNYGKHHKAPFMIRSVTKRIRKKAKERERARAASGGGEIFFMVNLEDLSATDGEVMLLEYSEEHPPLIQAVGMASRVKNYYRKKASKDTGPQSPEIGEMVMVNNNSPFLGSLSHGQLLQAFENNLYRTPIYKHKMPDDLFLVIKNHNGYHIREAKWLHTGGQLCPKFEVPSPNSKKASNFVRDFLQVYIYRLFAKSTDNPKRIKMDAIKKSFTSHSESSIRKRLKLCADFKRTGDHSNYWILKPDFRLPSEEELRDMVTPEQACAYACMLAAEQKLKDAGYVGKTVVEDEDNEDSQKIEDEVKTAPWNTTRAFLQALQGKCQLSLTGDADPTGCGEGFAYVRVPNKPVVPKDESNVINKQRTVTGTDADLRKLSLKNARQVLRDFGISDEEIKKLSRWEVIDVVRTMSTAAVKSGEDGLSKFARGSRFSLAEHQERYREECQRIFEIQNKVLASEEVLSTDEESVSEGDDEFDELGKNLESMLMNKKSAAEYSNEREEAERLELKKMLSEDDVRIHKSGSKSQLSKISDKDEDDKASVISETSSMRSEQTQDRVPGSRLIIHRTFSQDGREFVRNEVVTDPEVIDAYIRIATNKKGNIRSEFATFDREHREDIRKEKKRIQEKLRRLERAEKKAKEIQNKKEEKLQPVTITAQPPQIENDTAPELSTLKKDQSKQNVQSESQTKKKKEKPPVAVNLRCGACGEKGHMKTNKNCPKYNETMGPSEHVIAMTEEQIKEEEDKIAEENFVKVEGTKLLIGKALLHHHDEVRRRSLVLRFPKAYFKRRRVSRSSSNANLDYLKGPTKSKNRRRTAPEVTLANIFEEIVIKMRNVKNSHVFHFPVASKELPDYHRIVKRPMDLQTIKMNIRERNYNSREEFLEHCSLLVTNSVHYNGGDSPFTKTAQEMFSVCTDELEKKDKEISQLERELNPLLDDDPEVGISWLFEHTVMQMKSVPDSFAFHGPVDVMTVPDYYTVIKDPIDLGVIQRKAQNHEYRSHSDFMKDIDLLFANCVKYNGENEYTKIARMMVATCNETLDEFSAQIQQLERELAGVSSENDKIDNLMDSSDIVIGETEKFHHSSGIGKEIIERDEEEMDVDLSDLKDGEDKGIIFVVEGQDSEPGEVDIMNIKPDQEPFKNDQSGNVMLSPDNILDNDLNLSSSDDDYSD
ncbi:Transcription initiation factor TFIID subunit 1 [Trichoplax sp. H2]|nr:Transcription initiation factor TFIID subunit 1 [Trichoplax sp. H2]|eukprot:RDD46850.1 Transcription initiation factor TFIID subunit 1 [Trichoplax sp. H2]